ncbi:MAG: DNA polymerase III subunit beta [Anaerolineae bacterium]|jgi:DNA polymerase-3 subunit beta|nr:DNA polymerase III subunit beta [Anaerolineae bacterium]
MKVTVTQQQLAHGLSLVSKAIAPRSTLPVLANVLLATDEGRLRLSATNLEMAITCWIGAKIEEEGAITVPSRTFVDLVSALPQEDVTLDDIIKTNTLNVHCGKNHTDIKGIDAQEFPPIPVPDLQDGVSLNVSDFKEMIQQVTFAASSDEARPVLQGVLMEINDNKLSLVATDGFRISVRKGELSGATGKSHKLIIPARALNEAARIAGNSDEPLVMVVPPSRGQVIFHTTNAELVSQLIDGNFPDYKSIMPNSYKTMVTFSTPALLKACRQAEIIAREGSNVVVMNVMPENGGPARVQLSAQSEETGQSEIVVDAALSGPELQIAFNVKYLREALDVINTPNVILEANAKNTPAMLCPAGDNSFQHIVMPMHVN